MRADSTTLLTGKAHFTLAHIAWITMFLSILIWGFGEVPTDTLGNTGNWYRIILNFIGTALAVLVLFRNGMAWVFQKSGPLVFMLLFGLIAVISSIYIPEYSLYAMYKGYEVVVDVLVVLGLVSIRAPQDGVLYAYRIFLYLFASLMCLYWIEALWYPSVVFLSAPGYLPPYRMQGVLPVMNGNSLAYVAATLAFAGICAWFRTRRAVKKAFLIGFIGFALLTLILAQSRTSVIGFAAALAVYLFFDRRWGWLALLGLTVILVLGFTQFANVAETYLIRGQNVELLENMSGRTVGWAAAWKLFLESPVIGYGFAAAARVRILGITGASSLHGSVFDVLVGVGLLGLIPWALAILWTGMRLFRMASFSHPWFRSAIGRSIHAEMLGVYTLVIVRSSTGSTLAMHEHTFMQLLAVTAYTVAMLRAVRSARKAQPIVVERSPHVAG